jgi:porin
MKRDPLVNSHISKGGVALALTLLLTRIALLGTSPAQAESDARDPGLLGWPPNIQSPYATGDWWGGRTWLAEHGISIYLDYYGEVFWNTRGGIRTTEDGVYSGLFELAVEISTESAGLWDGGTLFFLFRNKHGQGITEDYVGGFQALSKIEAPPFTNVAELWYSQSFLEDRIWIKIGKMDANVDFAGIDHGEEFINASADYSPTIPLASYPDPDLGFALGIEPMPWLSVNFGVYNGAPDADRSLRGAFADLSGPMVLAQPAFHYGLFGRQGHIRAGGWFNGTETESPDSEDPEPKSYGEAYGWYLTLDQEIWRERPEDEEDEQGMGVFGQYGWAPPDRSAAEHYVGAGIRWAGMIPRRDRDVAGTGVFHVRFSDEANLERDTETVVEAFYRIQLLGCLALKPDLQYIINPGGTANPDALAVGLRFETSL